MTPPNDRITYHRATAQKGSKMSNPTHNCVYYWEGGTERGKWHCARPQAGKKLADLSHAMERMGYTCRFGHTRIGPPEGPPRT